MSWEGWCAVFVKIHEYIPHSYDEWSISCNSGEIGAAASRGTSPVFLKLLNRRLGTES